MTKIRLKHVNVYRDQRGRIYRYVRKPGMLSVRLYGQPGSPEFMEAYGAAVAGEPMPKGHEYKAESFGALVERYYCSVEFKNLSEKSKAIYRHVLGRMVHLHGRRGVADLPHQKARKIIEDIGATAPGMANLTRAVLVTVFEFAIECELRQDNPFKRVPMYKLGTRHTWTDTELQKFEARWPLGTRERLAYAVLLYSAQRVGDAVRLKRGELLSITQQKTGAELTIPIHPALARAIKACPAKGIYLIGDEAGRPLRPATLTMLIRNAVAAAGLSSECKAHGLRKAALRRLAEHSATTKGIAAVSGHKTLREVERYTAKASQARLAAAAIALLPDEEAY